MQTEFWELHKKQQLRKCGKIYQKNSLKMGVLGAYFFADLSIKKCSTACEFSIKTSSKKPLRH
jgi:hypothetical protein